MTLTASLFAQTTTLNVLLFTKTAGYRHASIPAGIKIRTRMVITEVNIASYSLATLKNSGIKVSKNEPKRGPEKL